MEFAWDARKAETNRHKHGVTFEEAATVFADPMSLTIADPLRSENEARFILMRNSARQRLLVVAHFERDDTIPPISARPATPRERKQDEQGG
ncbi:MAG TPA: BrnT family toxin [Armatimonadota bacterium]|nr:BrnT family toxin [Armatimonadota bacterium]